MRLSGRASNPNAVFHAVETAMHSLLPDDHFPQSAPDYNCWQSGIKLKASYREKELFDCPSSEMFMYSIGMLAKLRRRGLIINRNNGAPNKCHDIRVFQGTSKSHTLIDLTSCSYDLQNEIVDDT